MPLVLDQAALSLPFISRSSERGKWLFFVVTPSPRAENTTPSPESLTLKNSLVNLPSVGLLDGVGVARLAGGQGQVPVGEVDQVPGHPSRGCIAGGFGAGVGGAA